MAAPQPDRAIPWAEIAELVCTALTPAELERVLGDVPGFPPMRRAVQVRWRIPLYLLAALERLTEDDRASDPTAAGRTVEATAVQRLELALDPGLVQALSRDPAFRRAFWFPEGE